jgi:hypothetical protein
MRARIQPKFALTGDDIDQIVGWPSLPGCPVKKIWVAETLQIGNKSRGIDHLLHSYHRSSPPGYVAEVLPWAIPSDDVIIEPIVSPNVMHNSFAGTRELGPGSGIKM